jgi:hypothetical protein
MMSRSYWILALGGALILVVAVSAVLMIRPSSETVTAEVESNPLVTVNRSPT